MQLTVIALNNGFPNIKSFTETFKRFYGCTPSAWNEKEKMRIVLIEGILLWHT